MFHTIEFGSLFEFTVVVITMLEHLIGWTPTTSTTIIATITSISSFAMILSTKLSIPYVLEHNV